MRFQDASGKALPFLIGLVLLAQCGRLLAPREGWSERWGPLVPHKTFPGDCALCHQPDGWNKLRDDFEFDHAKQTGHPLEGAHKQAACLRCHNDFGPVTAYVARGCQGCHLDVHQAKLGVDCRQCHTEENWRPQGLVAEHARTRFPLYGAHLAAACEQCHTRAPAGDYRGATTDCAICHKAALEAARNPDHVAQGWTSSCERCHTATTWAGAGFTHAFFPLSGGHAAVDCAQCHTGGTFKGAPRDCFACHADDFQGAPDHVSGGFSHSCELCHTTDSWQGATVDHSFFPLEQGHKGLDCVQCHTGGSVGPIDASCYACHRPDYDKAPDHVTGNFPRTCEQCHTTAGWDGANIDHSAFPLEGGHSKLDCSRCHTGGSLSKIPADCFACHRPDYDKAPDHELFPTSCEDCHTIQRFKGATFRHAFPLRSEHNASCATCHTSGTSKQFSCFECHEHSRSRMDSKHRDVSGYSYTSQACLDCHPQGKGD